MGDALIIHAAVEGIIDEAVARKLILGAGGFPGTVYGKSGKLFLLQKIQGFNNAAKSWPWLVLVDLDKDADCAPPFCKQWVPEPAPHLCFRVAVREVEAWLLADAESLASFLGLDLKSIPKDPEGLDDPKRAMVNLARRSRRSAIKKDMVPRAGSGRPVGPAYASRLIEYVQNSWRPDVAGKKSESLRRAIGCLRLVIKGV
ncbi:MAG: hypothetical protein V2I40_03490 [Desulfobacteraceae bacterium]|jgi:hypothetical protein|nr:hypothetical protein [Desulfobacteraceae bacterium]